MDYPSKANHPLRYARRVYNRGLRRGFRHKNPAAGLEAAVERKRRRLPAHDVQDATIAHAKEHFEGYLWITLALAYLLNLRGIEVIALTDDLVHNDGIQTNRRKRSRDNVVL